MDINNYNYTPTLLDDKEHIIASFDNEKMYGSISMQNWGKGKIYHVSICNYEPGNDISEIFPFNKNGYELSARLYNEYTNKPIPLF